MTGARLLPFRGVYNGGAGHQATDTSRAAAEKVSLTLALKQSNVMTCLKRLRAATCDEIAYELEWPVTSVRPRCTELQKLGHIRDSGTRRPTPGGGRAIVWEVAS